MARNKGGSGPGNEYKKMIKNYQLIGAGKKQTIPEILKEGPKDPSKGLQGKEPQKQEGNKFKQIIQQHEQKKQAEKPKQIEMDFNKAKEEKNKIKDHEKDKDKDE